ncbi:MAG: Xaa-Pro peptidase family protein [Nanoarchaeota archaeon]|nr:Xaa-Pro peptidase family protein [Nanoarchaeota archaeon]MBU1269200.1 Xaa-Pro peptidase family protein [Nanoarchaeota archaeon]MBU1605040.1 Xaa-Pro peptidase family protein [Nanoarchaeota archaeon]
MIIKKIQDNLMKARVNACLLFFSDPNFFYVMGREVDESALLIPKNGKPTLFVNALEDVKTDFKKVVYKKLFERIKRVVKHKKIFVLGINESKVSVKQKRLLNKFVRTKNVESIFQQARKIKTNSEINKIKTSCSLAELILQKIVDNFNFEYEDDVRKFIKLEAIKLGCQLSFEPIVASGKNSRIPHYSGNQKMRGGFLILDFGLKYKGYCSDISRTVYIGTPSNKELSIYNFILEIQKEAIKMLKPGVDIRIIEEFVRNRLGHYSKQFTHSLGHGLGVEIHELPNVNLTSKDVLREGMVITIEPGIYKDFGIRIEDDILITKKGTKSLTTFDKSLIIIPKV